MNQSPLDTSSPAASRLRWLGVALALLSTWPLWHALAAVGEQDYVGALVLSGLTWLLARTGVELSGLDREANP